MKFQNAKIIGDNISPEVYLAQTAKRGEKDFIMSRGQLMKFLDNPHKWILGSPDEETESTVWGNLIDTLALSPSEFSGRYAVAPENYPSKGMECPTCKSVTDSKSCRKCGCDRVEKIVEKPWDWNSNYCIEWRDKQNGKEVIKHTLRESARTAEARLIESKMIQELLECSKHQVMVMAEYKDGDTGLIIPVKALLDLVPDKDHARFGKTLADLKTAVSCKPRLFEDAIFKQNYDCQASLYMDLYVSATGEDRVDWTFVAQENQEPYEVADPLPMLATNFLDMGRSKYSFALRYYAHCLALNEWPSYSIGQRDEINGRYIAEPSDWMVASAVDWPKISPITTPQPKIMDYRC